MSSVISIAMGGVVGALLLLALLRIGAHFSEKPDHSPREVNRKIELAIISITMVTTIILIFMVS